MKYMAGIMAVLLSACSSLPQADTNGEAPFLRQYRITDRNGADSLVLGEYQGGGRWRWLQSSVLGAPLARQIYQNGAWHNDGFLPPNAPARQLFTALMLSDNPQSFPSVAVKKLPRGRQFYYRQQPWLKEQCIQDNDCQIQTGQYQWRVRELLP